MSRRAQACHAWRTRPRGAGLWARAAAAHSNSPSCACLCSTVRMVVPAVLTTCQKMRMEHCGKPLRAAGETGPVDAGSAAGASRAPTAGRCPAGSSAAGSSPPRSDSARLAALANPARSSAAATANSVLDNWPSELESARVNVAVLLSVLTSARSRGSHADVAEWKSHSATMHTKTMISAFVVRILLLAPCLPRCRRRAASKYGVKSVSASES